MEHLEDSERAANQGQMSGDKNKEGVLYSSKLHRQRREVQSEEDSWWERLPLMVS